MSHDESPSNRFAPVDLGHDVHAQGADLQLFCCQTPGPTKWVSAAELVYELTGNAGSVVRNTIHFELDKGASIDLDLLDGSFTISKGEKVLSKGRKGLEFLMAYKSMSLEQALEFVASTYSLDSARVMAEDYVRMHLRKIEAKLARHSH